ncbi:SPX domain-containing protein 2 [Quercus suber]
MLYKLVECDAMLDRIFPKCEPPASTMIADGDDDPSTSDATNNNGLLRVPKELAEIEYMESLYMKSTISALRVLKEIQSGSSTVGHLSLPPLQFSAIEETWNKVPDLEQVAK